MSSPPLVLHTRVVTGAGGGPEKTILNSPRYLEEAGYRLICAYMRDPRNPHFEQLEIQARDRGARLMAIDDRGPLDWRILESFRSICRDHRPAIWHGHDYKSNFLGLLVRRSQPMRLVATAHGWVQHTWKTPLYYAIDRQCLRRYDGVICVSQDIRETCLRLGIPSTRCWLVPNAIDTEEWRRREQSESAKIRSGLRPGRLLVGAVGRLEKEKDFARLIAAIGQLLVDDFDPELWIAGEGPRKSALQRLIDQTGLGDRVRLLGHRSDLVDVYKAMDVFVVSSLREGLPNVLLEAMALEVPVLCTRVAGIPDLVRDGENGLLVDPGSTSSLAAGLKRLLRDADLRQRLGRAGRKTVESSHSFRARMATIKSIYDHLLGKGELNMSLGPT